VPGTYFQPETYREQLAADIFINAAAARVAARLEEPQVTEILVRECFQLADIFIGEMAQQSRLQREVNERSAATRKDRP
jgi:hypothetical protein